MKRVVMFTPGLSEAGGAASRSRLLCLELVDRGWDVRVVTRAGTLRGFSSTQRPGYRVIEVPGFDSPRLGAILFLLVAVPLGLIWGVRARAFISMQISSQTTAAGLCGLLLRRPYVALLTTGGSVSELAYILSRRSAPFRKRVLEKATALVAQTDHAAHELRTALPRAAVTVAANPVVAVEATPLDGRPRALFTGRLSEEKDLLSLLDAWERISSDDPSARLTIAGAGGSYRSVEPQVRTAIRERKVLAGSVEMTGWVGDVGKYLATHDVYVFPSLSEGMSNSLLEACAAGRVVVASDIPANAAVVGPGYPLLFEAGNRDAMEATLRAALYEESMRSEAIAVIRARMSLFSLDSFVDRIEALLP